MYVMCCFDLGQTCPLGIISQFCLPSINNNNKLQVVNIVFVSNGNVLHTFECGLKLTIVLNQVIIDTVIS